MTTKAEAKANVISTASSTVGMWLELHSVPRYIVVLIAILATLGLGWVAHNAHMTGQAGDIAAIVILAIVWDRGVGRLLVTVAQ